ncbi:hypothetical protein TWF694_001264 [Orbilia ellipsospora]|uniref:Fungal N-terminal domain-containing protein n=1 Tax=Orbilia ellipsospora TaxID=2528407 RepID=A0AAV9XRJ8_9PEZI
MTEVLGAVASGLQLVETAIKVGSKIYEFVHSIKSAPKKAVAFRRNLDQSIILLKEIEVTLKVAKVEYTKVGDTAYLIETTLTTFRQELGDISDSVETLYANPKTWRSRVRIGLKGDGEWERFDRRIKEQYNKLTAASVQLSNKLNIENGSRINEVKAEVQAVGVEIVTNVSAPLNSVQQDVQTIRNTGDTSILLIQESMALQISSMQRMEQLHGHQFQRITEIQEDVAINHNETVQTLARVENTCATISVRQEDHTKGIHNLEEKIGDVTGLVQKLADDLTTSGSVDITAQSQAVLDGLQKLNISPPPSHSSSTYEPKSREDRLKLERQKRNLSSAVRQILRLAEDPSAVKLVKGPDAEDYVNAVQQLLDTLQDDSEGGQDLKHELAAITSQLLGTKSLYMQRAPDTSLSKKLEGKGEICRSVISAFESDADLKENKEIQKVKPLDNGTLVISSRSQRLVSEDENEVTSTQTTLTFKPNVREGESKPSWVASILNTYGTEGAFSVPLLIRVHNRRYFSPFDDECSNGLASIGDLESLQKLFSSGEASVYDVNQVGQSLLHIAINSLSPKDYPGRRKNRMGKCFSVCKFLLEQGADVNLLDDRGNPPLSFLDMRYFDKITEKSSDMENFKFAHIAFFQLLEAGIENKKSPFGPEQAIANLIRKLVAGSSQILRGFLSRLDETEIDINCYSGSRNAITLEFAVLSGMDPALFSQNLDIALEYGGDIRAKTFQYQESCLHLTLKILEIEPDDAMVTSELKWESFKNWAIKLLSKRLHLFLSLGADMYAKDIKHLKFPNRGNIHCTVTRDMYIHEVQETWWEVLTELGISREELLSKESKELEVSKEEYEAYLDSLAKRSFDERQTRWEKRE